MAATYVASANGSNTGSGATSLATSSTVAMNTGSTVIAIVSWESADDTPTVTDGTNTYTGLTKTKDTGHNQWLQIFYAKNVTSGTRTVTYNHSTSVSYRVISVVVFDGLDTTSPFGAESYEFKTGTATPAFASAPSISAAGVIVVGLKAWSTQNPTTTAGSGYTNFGRVSDTGFGQYRISTGAESPATSYNGTGSTDWIIGAASFLEATAGASGVPKSTKFLMTGIG